MSAELGWISSVRAPNAWDGDGATCTSSRTTRVLVVDDDPSLRHMLRDYLEQHNMRVVTASQRQEASRQFAAAETSMVILDRRLGQEDGLDLLREIRSRSDVPVIIISGHRRDEVDRVVGLELGADDYVTKPFCLRELLARVRAVLRRSESGRITSQRESEQGRYRFGGWQLDRRARRLTDPSGAPIALTKAEYALLIAFVDAPQRPLTREHLLQATRIAPTGSCSLQTDSKGGLWISGVSAWCKTEPATECSGEVSVVVKAAGVGDLTDRPVRIKR
jgi:two-component system OmpR family response regulator